MLTVILLRIISFATTSQPQIELCLVEPLGLEYSVVSVYTGEDIFDCVQEAPVLKSVQCSAHMFYALTEMTQQRLYNFSYLHNIHRLSNSFALLESDIILIYFVCLLPNF